MLPLGILCLTVIQGADISADWRDFAFWLGLLLCVFGIASPVFNALHEETLARLEILELRLELSRYNVVTASDSKAPEVVIAGDIPGWFVVDFWRNCSELFLCQIDHYNAAGVRNLRPYAEKLTALLVKKEFAQPAAGRYPARWIDKRAAEEYLSPALGSLRTQLACAQAGISPLPSSGGGVQ